MKSLFSIVFVFKSIIYIVAALFVLEIAVFTCSTVSSKPGHRRSFLKFILDYEMPKDERAISLLVLTLFTCKE